MDMSWICGVLDEIHDQVDKKVEDMIKYGLRFCEPKIKKITKGAMKWRGVKLKTKRNIGNNGYEKTHYIYQRKKLLAPPLTVRTSKDRIIFSYDPVKLNEDSDKFIQTLSKYDKPFFESQHHPMVIRKMENDRNRQKLDILYKSIMGE